jgi:hypothetical protein
VDGGERSAEAVSKPKKQDRRTKREREADELSTEDFLWAAQCWQNGEGVESKIDAPEHVRDLYMVVGDCGDDRWIWFDLWASAALSEVAWHRGHTIANADGSPTEHVTSFTTVGGVRGEDGTEREFYGAAKRGKR